MHILFNKFFISQNENCKNRINQKEVLRELFFKFKIIRHSKNVYISYIIREDKRSSINIYKEYMIDKGVNYI